MNLLPHLDAALTRIDPEYRDWKARELRRLEAVLKTEPDRAIRAEAARAYIDLTQEWSEQ